jgi:hypothetical protein
MRLLRSVPALYVRQRTDSCSLIGHHAKAFTRQGESDATAERLRRPYWIAEDDAEIKRTPSITNLSKLRRGGRNEFAGAALRGEHPIWGNVEVRTCKYLNNIVEQDHRAIKRRCASMMGFKSFHNASIALAGVELAHRIRKRQFSFGRGRPPCRSMRTMWAIVMV